MTREEAEEKIKDFHIKIGFKPPNLDNYSLKDLIIWIQNLKRKPILIEL